jgi:membrane-associated phospholipid phosphatase
VNLHRVVVWWPLIALVAMVALGAAVGKGSTPIDGVFTRLGDGHRLLRRMLYFSDLRLQLALLLVCIAVAAYRRRWRLTAVIVVTPFVALVAERVAKRAFGRRYDGALAYPSGHTTMLWVLLGFAVILAGAATWTVVVAVAYGVLGLLGQSFTYHYFTDTVGGVLLGTALLCLAARAAGLDRCQPECDVGHSNG